MGISDRKSFPHTLFKNIKINFSSSFLFPYLSFPSLPSCLSFLVFQTGSNYIFIFASNSNLFQPPECWDYQHVPQCRAVCFVLYWNKIESFRLWTWLTSWWFGLFKLFCLFVCFKTVPPNVDQASLEFPVKSVVSSPWFGIYRHPCVSLSLMLGLQVCSSIPWYELILNICILFGWILSSVFFFSFFPRQGFSLYPRLS